MYTKLSRTILSLTLIFVLFGQGIVPLSESCDMAPDSAIAMEVSDHEAMQHGNDLVKKDMPNHDCCDTIECSCLNGMCTTTLIAALEQNITPDIRLTSKISTIDSHLSAANSQLLIRPPIIA